MKPLRVRTTVLAATGTLCLIGAAGTGLPMLSSGATTVATRNTHLPNHGRLDSTFGLEAAPPMSAGDAAALAAAPVGVDPVAFDRGALEKALAAARTSGTWRQVGARGAIINSQDYATDEGRLPTTGIVLSIAADPADRTGSTVYIGTGGGLFKTTDGGAHWSQASIPAMPVAGVAVDPTNHDNVYALTGQGFQGGGEFPGLGLYYSHDAGRTWTVSSSSVHGAGQQVSVSPQGGTVFAATTGGLFRSTDHGVSFTDVQLPTNAAGTAPASGTPVGSWTSDVAVRPGHPNEVFAAVGYVAGQVKLPNGANAAPGNGLYKSTQYGLPGTFHRVDITSQSSGWEQEPLKSNDPIGRTRLKFTPDGATLFALVADAGHRAGGFFGPVDPYDPLGLPNPTSLNGVYRSSDDGSTWNLIADSESMTPSPGSTQAALSAVSLLGYDTGIQAWYNGWIDFDKDSKRVLVGEEEVYQSAADATQGAPTPGPQLIPFQSIDAYVSACGLVTQGSCPDGTPFVGGQVTHPDQHGVAVVALPSGGTRLWIGNDGGPFRQDHAAGAAFQNGAWTATATLNQLLPYRAVEGTNGEVIGGLQDNGTILYPPNSQNSYEICGGDGTWVAVDPRDPKVFYCNANGAIYQTTDGGKTIQYISPVNGPAPQFLPAAAAMDPTDPSHLVIGGSDVEELTNAPNENIDPSGQAGSPDWVSVYTNPTTDPGIGDPFGLTATVATTQAIDVYGAAVYDGSCSVCQSSVKLPITATDRELSTNVKPGCTPKKASTDCWHQAKLIGMPARLIGALAIDPKDVKTVYIGTQVPSVIRVDFGGAAAPRLLISHDGGDHVSDVSGNLPRGNVWDVKVFGNYVYVATDYGVFTAPKGSTTWSRLGSGMPMTRVFGLSISANHKDLVAATYGTGVWLYSLAQQGNVVHARPAPKATGQLPRTGGPIGLAIAGLVLLTGAAISWRTRPGAAV